MSDEFLFCIPLSKLAYPHTASRLVECCDCGQKVWRALSSPEAPIAMCMLCALKRLESGEKMEFGGMTAEQLHDVIAHIDAN